MQRLPVVYWRVIVTVLSVLCVSTSPTSASTDPNCFLSASENVTFTTSAYTVVARKWSEAAVVSSGAWAPSLDSQYSSIVIGNDTTVPTFWLQAVPISSSIAGDDYAYVHFFDQRFQLCVEFNGLRKFCVNGSSTIPGQFMFQNIYLPSGNWVFRVATMTFLPQQYVISLPSSSTFCCVNVTSPLSVYNASLLRFSPRRNNGLWYQRKSVCAAVGKVMPPITVSTVRLDNTSWLGNGGLEPSVALMHENVVFRLRIVSGLPSSSAATADASVYGSWNVTVPKGLRGEVTFQNVSVSQFLAAPSIVIDVYAVSSSTFRLNTLVVLLVLDRIPRASCALFISQQRTPPFISNYFGRWGAPVRVLASMPTISIGLMQGDGSLSDATGQSFEQPLLVSVEAHDVNGQLLTGVLGGSTAVILASGLCSFSGLYVKNVSRVFGSLIFLSFHASRTDPRQSSIIEAVSVPLIVMPSTSSPSSVAEPALIVLDPRNSQFYADGIVGVNTLNTTLPATRLFLMDDASQRVVSAANVGIVVEASIHECSNVVQLQAVSVQSPTGNCMLVSAIGLHLSGAVSRSFGLDGTVSFTDLRIVADNAESLSGDFKRIVALTFTVVSVHSSVSPYLSGYSLSLTSVILQEAAPVTDGRVGFIRGKRLPSLLTDELQPAHCILGVPLPPIIIALFRPGSTNIDRRNSTLFITAESGASLLHAHTVFRYGVAQFPGLVIAASRMPVARITFTVWYTDGGGLKQRLQVLESGPITILHPSLVVRPYLLRFSMLSSSYICHEDVVVGVLNNSAIPTFVVEATRPDYLLSGIRQTIRSSVYTNSASVAPHPTMESDSVNCSVRNGLVTTTATFPLGNGSAIVRIPAISFQESTVVLQCCLAIAEAPQSCTSAVTLTVGVPSRLLYGSALGAVTSEAQQAQSSGSSIPSSTVSNALLDANSSIEASLTLYCQDNETVPFQLCASISGTNSSIFFLQPLRYVSDAYVAVSTDFDGVAVLNGNAASRAMALGGEDSFLSDGLQGIVFDIPNDSEQINVDAKQVSTELVSIRQVSAPLMQVIALYVDAPDLGQSSSLLVEQLASLINADSVRLSIGSVSPASYPLPTSHLPRAGVSNLLGTRLELRVLPRITSSNSDTVGRITNQILGVFPSCLQQTALTSASRSATFIRGFLTEGHATLSAGSTKQLSTAYFCDVSLFESLAESARHCELFLGPDKRCSCFTALFRAMGRACVGQRILVSVCDHMAYCTDSGVTDVCSLVQPNVPLQVFFVVGGTILGLGVVAAIVKFKSILRFVSQARYRMHENEGNVLSKQSAASVNVFTP